ncbi:MAG TPA: hypothetical protein VFC69_01850 [Dysgonamonadaceae bacterium]|nr:hypothetical protein [Dysgonamonadaceae bacterium]
MFDELKKYENSDHFFVTSKVELEDVCNAPKNGSGVYVVYELKNGRIDLIYIGSSGKVQSNGKIQHSEDGLYGEIVSGVRLGKTARRSSWKQKVIREKIDALDVYWFETINADTHDIPSYVEATIMQRFYELYGRLPRWNREF